MHCQRAKTEVGSKSRTVSGVSRRRGPGCGAAHRALGRPASQFWTGASPAAGQSGRLCKLYDASAVLQLVSDQRLDGRASRALRCLGGGTAAGPPLLEEVRSAALPPLRQAGCHGGCDAAPTTWGSPSASAIRHDLPVVITSGLMEDGVTAEALQAGVIAPRRNLDRYGRMAFKHVRPRCWVRAQTLVAIFPDLPVASASRTCCRSPDHRCPHRPVHLASRSSA